MGGRAEQYHLLRPLGHWATRKHHLHALNPWGRFSCLTGKYSHMTEGPSPWLLRPMRTSAAALAHTHPQGSRRFSNADMHISHGWFRTLGIPAIPVFMSVNLSPAQRARYGHTMEVRRYDSSMNRDEWGRLILTR